MNECSSSNSEMQKNVQQSGKNKRKQCICYDSVHNITLSVDSNEEEETLEWLCEAKSLSIINDFSYQPPSFQLAEAVKQVDVNGKERTLFREHIYTADWIIDFTPSAQLKLAAEMKIPYEQLSCEHCSVLIDCKGMYNVTERAFSYNQKWMWQKFKKYVYKLIPRKFFATFGVPDACRKSKKLKLVRKHYISYKSVKKAFNIGIIDYLQTKSTYIRKTPKI